MHDRQAVIFDLDDTLYPYRQFRASGFAAVADHLHRAHGSDARQVLARLLRDARGGNRGRELQACLASQELPADYLGTLLDVVRGHTPRLRLPAQTASVLWTLRRDGWRLGVVTNGDSAVQRRKMAALTLDDAVDAVVYAADCGSGAGKPEAEAFLEASRRLRVRPGRAVFVGNDERCDIAGAANAGMWPVLCTAWTDQTGPTTAHHVVGHLSEIPAVALALLNGALKRHVA
jgi:putative hydrolase of the HAD superfamily